MTDFLSEPVDGFWFALIFGMTSVVAFIFGMHALIVARQQDRPLRTNFPFWLGVMLLLSTAVTNGTFAMFFYLGMAKLTMTGLFIYGPGCLATQIAFVVWTRTGPVE